MLKILQNNNNWKAAMSLCILQMLLVSSYAQGDGYGITNGGNAGPTVTVSNLTDFTTYAGSSQPYVIMINGTINVGSGIAIASNKTIAGVDTNSTIIGALNVKNVKNVIVKHINITNNAGDGITIRQSSNVFVTHCTVYDCGDGCIDITVQSDSVSISYCRFYYVNVSVHKFVNLIGASDTDTLDREKLHVTLHHNWWDKGCAARMPLVRFGQVHMYNNYFSCLNNQYSSRSRLEAQILSEYNYYDGIRDPLTAEEGGIVKSIGNIYLNCYNVIYPGNDSVFRLGYTYSLSSAECAKEVVLRKAGNTNPDIQYIASVTRATPGINPHVLKVDSAITEIIYKWTNADSVTVTGLPTGIEAITDCSNQSVKLQGTPTDTGTYVFTISTSGCAENITFNDTILVVQGFTYINRSIMNISNVQLYPNPVNTNVINISGSLKESEKVTVHIYNQLGVIIESRDLGVIEKGNFKLHFPVGNVKTGLYILQFQMNADIKTIPFIKQ